MKKVDWLIIKSFLGPFLATFFVVEFVFIMQFFYIYIDDFIGKGLEWYLILQLVAYLSANTVPLALPLAILLASIMTFGNLGERFELMALKSAGINLIRFMSGLLVLTVIMGIGSLAFNNYILPTANLNFYTTLADITHKKPALNIKEDVFYSDIRNYVIKIDHKEIDNRHIRGIYIQDMSDFSRNQVIITAESGEMFTTSDKMNLVLRLFNGARYEIIPARKAGDPEKTYVKTYFDELEKVIDLSDLQMVRTNKNLYKGHYIMLNIPQLHEFVDSLRQDANLQIEEIDRTLKPYFYFKKPPEADTNRSYQPDTTISDPPEKDTLLAGTLADYIPPEKWHDTYSRAVTFTRNIKTSLQSPILPRYENDRTYILKASVELERKYTLAVACLVLFLIGAPFGAIVRKGGIGLPLIASVLLYIFYLVLSRIGESLAMKEVLPLQPAMWMATIIMLPIGIFLTYKAAHDSSLLQTDYYSKFIKRLLLGKSAINNKSKE